MVRGKQIRVSSVADTVGVESTAGGLVIVLPCGFGGTTSWIATPLLGIASPRNRQVNPGQGSQNACRYSYWGCTGPVRRRLLGS